MLTIIKSYFTKTGEPAPVKIKTRVPAPKMRNEPEYVLWAVHSFPRFRVVPVKFRERPSLKRAGLVDARVHGASAIFTTRERARDFARKASELVRQISRVRKGDHFKI